MWYDCIPHFVCHPSSGPLSTLRIDDRIANYHSLPPIEPLLFYNEWAVFPYTCCYFGSSSMWSEQKRKRKIKITNKIGDAKKAFKNPNANTNACYQVIRIAAQCGSLDPPFGLCTLVILISLVGWILSVLSLDFLFCWPTESHGIMHFERWKQTKMRTHSHAQRDRRRAKIAWRMHAERNAIALHQTAQSIVNA